MGTLIKNGVVYGGGNQIDDTQVSTETTWSSEKISNEAGMHNYSTEEQVVGTWIDGKPIYQRVVILDSPSKGGYNNIPHHIENVKDIINIGPLITGSGETHLTITNLTSYSNIASVNGTFTCVVAGASQTFVRILNGNDFTKGAYLQDTITIVLEYTKTTD